MSTKVKVIAFWRGIHNSGTKFYEVAAIRTPDGRTLAIRRYGKVSLIKKGGATMIEDFNRSAIQRLIGTKSSGGYDFSKGGTEGFPKNTEGEIELNQILAFYYGTSQYDEIKDLIGGSDVPTVTHYEDSPVKAAPVKSGPASSTLPGWGAW